MRLLGAFLVHETRAQFRSLRFRALALAYLALAIAPAVLVHLFGADWLEARGGGRIAGPGVYAFAVSALQPWLTSIVCAVLAVDALEREREDGSLAVLGLAPMTDAGYLLRRYAALAAILVALTALPPAGAALLAYSATPSGFDLGLFLWPWLVHTLPLALAVSAFALGAGTIARGLLPAALLSLLLLVAAFDLVNSIHLRYHRILQSPLDWLGSLQDPYILYHQGQAISDAPHDPAALLDVQAAPAVLCMGLAALVLAVAVRFLRRTRPDHRPWTVAAGHPLRNLIALANRLRERYHPDPAPARADRLVFLLGAALFVSAAGYVEQRFGRYLDLAHERYRVETGSEPDPTPLDVVAVAARIEGRIGQDGEIAVQSTLRLRNDGAEPAAHLAFDLAPALTAAMVPQASGNVRLTRAWDRLLLDLDPPLAPGAEATLVLDIAGTPAEVSFDLAGTGGFARRFRLHLAGRYAWDLSDLSRSRVVRAVSPRRTSLAASDLLPVPRYSSWSLTGPGATFEEKAVSSDPVIVPPESIGPPTELEIELAVPPGMLLADTCGSVALPGKDGSILRGRCRQRLIDFAVRGGPLLPVEVAGIGGFAALPAHLEQAREHAPALAAAAALGRRAWPGSDPLGNSVVLEWPPGPLELDWRGAWWYRRRQETLAADSSGRLLLVPELVLTDPRPLSPEAIAAEALATELASRRVLAESEQEFFAGLYRVLALARLGRLEVTRADIRGTNADRREASDEPLLFARSWSRFEWTRRLPALLADLEARIGARHVEEGLHDFLAAGAGGKGTARELFDAIATAAGEPLDCFYADFVAGRELPEMRLDDVVFAGLAGAWEAHGRLTNTGGGEVHCPVVLRTEVESVNALVRVEARSSSPFALRSAWRPRAVLLDPDGRCYRFSPSHRMIEGVERVEFRGQP